MAPKRPRTLIHDLYGEYCRFECVHTYNHLNMNIKEIKKNYDSSYLCHPCFNNLQFIDYLTESLTYIDTLVAC